MSSDDNAIPPESALMQPVLTFFGESASMTESEVPLGRRKIDLLVFDRNRSEWIAVELKVRDWRRAVKQARLNHLIAEQSYVAIWHKFAPNAMRNIDLFRHYRVGIIEVRADSARILLQFDSNPPDRRRDLQRQSTLKRLARKGVCGAVVNAPATILPA